MLRNVLYILATMLLLASVNIGCQTPTSTTSKPSASSSTSTTSSSSKSPTSPKSPTPENDEAFTRCNKQKLSHTIDGKYSKEWDHVRPLRGRFGYFYVEYDCITQTMYLLNDWVHRDDAPIGKNCYNLFNINCGIAGSFEVKVHANQTITISQNGRPLDVKKMEAKGASGFSSSPNMKKPHAIFEMKIQLPKKKDGYCYLQLCDPGPSFPNCDNPKESLTTEPNALRLNLSQKDKYGLKLEDTQPIVASISPWPPQPGKSLTLHGLNFGSHQGKVLFGRTNARIKVWSKYEIQLFPPQQIENKNLRVMLPDGTLSPPVHASSSCLPNCTDKSCGADGCGGSCGECSTGQFCSKTFTCEQEGSTCTPDCNDKQCGSDGCGGSCGECPTGLLCTVDQLCKPD